MKGLMRSMGRGSSLCFLLGSTPRARCRHGERLFACLDDLYICRLEKGGCSARIAQLLVVGPLRHFPPWERPRWNRSGVPRPGCATLQRRSRLLDAVVWRGDYSLPPHKKGFRVLGVPFGHPEFVKKFLQDKISEHKVLLDRIPAVQDTQSAWLLLSFRAAARSNFFLMAVSPQLTHEFAQAHDEGVWQCLCRILSVHSDCGAQNSRVFLWEGGIGLRSARRTASAAHWASWSDAR